MQGEGIIAGVIGLVGGAGGPRLLGWFLGGGRERSIAAYYREVIGGLVDENETLRARVASLEGRIEALTGPDGRLWELERAVDEKRGPSDRS